MTNVRLIATASSLVASVAIVAAFQNCAPVLPLDGVVDASSIATRATATPSSSLGSIGSGGVYTGSQYDGTCTWSPTDDSMAKAGTDAAGGVLLAFNGAGGKAAFWNLSGGAVARAAVCTLGSGYTVAAIGDFNGDLNPDILWRGNNQLVLWQMRGSTRIATAAILSGFSSGYNIEGVADFDGDGIDDILIRDASNNFAILKMAGQASPTTINLGSVSSTTHLVQIGTYFDANAGRKKPFLLFNDTSPTTGTSGFDTSKPVWYMNGSTVASASYLPSGFTSTTTTSNGVATTATYTVLGIGDFNGDTTSDFLLRDNATGNLHLRFSTYTGSNLAVLTDNSQENTPPPASWSLQGIQKVDGDNYFDWLWIVSGGSLPAVAYTPVAGSPGSLNTIGFIQSGYGLFKYSHL